MGNCTGKDPFNKQNSSAFDRVTSRTSTDDDCLLYQLADYQKGGDLVKFFTKEGPRATEDLLKEQIPLLLYRKGEGQVVTRKDYLKWKYRGKHQVAVPVDEHIPGWRDHKACWNFEYRGSLGESLLHVLIVCNTSKHFKLAKILLVAFPNLALDVVEGNEFRGASALHLAIAYNNLELIKLLVEAGAGIDQRAVGTFFLPKDQQRSKPAKTTDYEGLAYFGEFPLAWSACCNNEAAYNLLIDRGADPNAQDSFGNMVLHMVVVCDKLEMYGYALRHPRIQAKMGIVNKAGHTPLTLSCHLGRATIFREMLELTAKEFWRYSNITCSAYPLNALDTILPDGRSNMTSALMIILNGTKEEHLDMLDGGIIQRLLEEKWKTFARIQFLKRLGILFFHLMMLSAAVYTRPSQDRPLMADMDKLDGMDYARFCFEIITCLSCVGYVIVQQSSEVKNLGLKGFLTQLSHNPAKAIFLVSNILTLSCIPCRLYGKRELEEAILIFALPSAWFFLMFFAGAIRLTGPFVTMIYSMITGDMLTFAIIYSIMLLAFSQAFFFLHRGHPDKPALFSNFFSTWMGLFQWTLGDYNYPSLGETIYPALTKIVFVIFMIMVPILLLNMLIAMMGNTYALVIQQSEKEFVKQWAKIVIALERAVSQNHAKEYLVTYSIKVSGGSDGSDGSPPQEEVRGVMVIKSKNKTRARQRKGALNNWKRVGKVTIAYLKRRGITGEALRRQIWDPRTPSTTSMNGSPCLTPIPCPTNAAMLLMDMNGGIGDHINDSLLDNSFAFGAAFNDMSGFNGPNHKPSTVSIPPNLKDPLEQDLFNTALINKLSDSSVVLENIIEPSYTAPVAAAPPVASVNPLSPVNPLVNQVTPVTHAPANLMPPTNPTIPVNPVAPMSSIAYSTVPVSQMSTMSPAVHLNPTSPGNPVPPINPVAPMNPVAPGETPKETIPPVMYVNPMISVAPTTKLDFYPLDPMYNPVIPTAPNNPIVATDHQMNSSNFQVNPTYPITPVVPINPIDPSELVTPMETNSPAIYPAESANPIHQQIYPPEYVIPISQMIPTHSPISLTPVNAMCPFDPIHSINPMRVINQTITPTAPVSMFPPLPIPVDFVPPLVDLLDNSAQLSDIENEIIAQTLLSNVQQPIRVASRMETLPPLFRARLVDTPNQSIEAPEPVLESCVTVGNPMSTCADDFTADRIHTSSTPTGSRRQSTPNALFQRTESFDLVAMRGKSMSVVDSHYQPTIVIDLQSMQNERFPPLVVDDNLLDPSSGKGTKRGSKTRSRKHQFNRMNVVAPSDAIYHLDDHMQQLDMVNDLDTTRDSDIFQRLNERTFGPSRSLARSSTMAEDADDVNKKKKQKHKMKSPRRLRRHSDNESFASGVDESLFAARDRKQRPISRSSSSSSNERVKESKAAASPREQTTQSIDTEPPDTSRGVFHISGSETARTEDGKKGAARVRSPKMSAKPASNKKSIGKKVSAVSNKIKKVGLVGPVLAGKKSSRPARDSTGERATERTSVTSTSSRIDQAKSDHFHSQGSPAVLNLNQVMDAGIDSPAMDDI